MLKNLAFLMQTLNSLSAIFNFSEFYEPISQQPFLKGMSLNMFLKKCPCYYDVIFFSSQHVLDTYDA